MKQISKKRATKRMKRSAKCYGGWSEDLRRKWFSKKNGYHLDEDYEGD